MSNPRDKAKDLEIKELKATIGELKVQLAASKKDVDLAVKTKELELQKQNYDAIQKALKDGYDNAIKSLKEMKDLARSS